LVCGALASRVHHESDSDGLGEGRTSQRCRH
jgi:hypothetical protein